MTLPPKDELRRILRARRKALSSSARALKSRRILDRLRSHPSYLSARSPAFTHSVGAEVDLLPLLEERLSGGRGAILPTIRDGEMEFHRVAGPLNQLPRSERGVPEPIPSPATRVSPDELDLVVVPGVGFDPWGNRLGQGGGFFDRFLDRLPRDVHRIGLAFECQMVEEIPTEAFDRPVDEILTEAAVYRGMRVEMRSRSVEQTHRIAARASKILAPPALVRLEGSLGAGKTEWVRGFVRSLGSRKRVRSPSFSLENVYALPEATVHHLDGYRLTDPSGLDRDWFAEILEDPKGIVLLEWPDRFGEEVPRFAPRLEITRTEGDERELVWTSFELRHRFPESDRLDVE